MDVPGVEDDGPDGDLAAPDGDNSMEILSKSLALAFGRKYVCGANTFSIFEENKKAVSRGGFAVSCHIIPSTLLRLNVHCPKVLVLL